MRVRSYALEADLLQQDSQGDLVVHPAMYFATPASAAQHGILNGSPQPGLPRCSGSLTPDHLFYHRLNETFMAAGFRPVELTAIKVLQIPAAESAQVRHHYALKPVGLQYSENLSQKLIRRGSGEVLEKVRMVNGIHRVVPVGDTLAEVVNVGFTADSGISPLLVTGAKQPGEDAGAREAPYTKVYGPVNIGALIARPGATR